MKYFIDKIIVVEGKEDVSYLSSFIEAEYITTNGYDIPTEEVEYLNEASKYKEILVLVDPDKAGQEIENKLKSKLVKATYININIARCNRGKKNGVAECDKDEIVRVLEPHFSSKNTQKHCKIQGNLSKLDLTSKELREYLSKKYHLGKCNLKKLIQRLETLEITTEELENTIKEYYGN